jgi:pSer/pThr/pTyr-binding forkhead associated (FHA) protein
LIVLLGATQIAVSLLDPVKGHPIQTWEFDGQSLIRIGRGETNDVVVADPLVSRTHAELISDTAGRWRVVSLGRNGTLVDGEMVSDPTPVRHGTILQLGSNGPWVEFSEGRRASRGGETVSSISDLAMPEIDQELLKTEVSKIADCETFLDIQKQAQELRKAREES